MNRTWCKGHDVVLHMLRHAAPGAVSVELLQRNLAFAGYAAKSNTVRTFYVSTIMRVSGLHIRSYNLDSFFGLVPARNRGDAWGEDRLLDLDRRVEEMFK